ncbi:EamA family transporter [Pedobacter mucosus]|uniref:EamA family transporter n=1 Tax=Pedobacter mucosus TaxID=2895286 RepID=UPI001EE4B112|nr:EamA family transporter [Pedobacter mucosus]UKT63326.1 EamA family transporter [Pedobacter mucosus]
MWIFWAVLAAISAALVIVLTKAGLKTVDSNLAFAIQSVFILTITWGLVTFEGNLGTLKDIDTKTWIILICAGIATTLATVFSFKALSLGKASTVSTIERTSIVFAILLSTIFLKEKLTWQIIVGGILILSGAVFIALSEPE